MTVNCFVLQFEKKEIRMIFFFLRRVKIENVDTIVETNTRLLIRNEEEEQEEEEEETREDDNSRSNNETKKKRKKSKKI